MRVCRVGLVGAGGVAQRHARVLTGFEDVELLGVTDVARDAAEALAGTHGARAFADVDELLAAGPDAVYVCVPPFAHGPVEEAVIAAGVPMFVEKPVAVDLETAERIAGLVERRQLLTAVGHHWRYLHVVEQARELLDGRAGTDGQRRLAGQGAAGGLVGPAGPLRRAGGGAGRARARPDPRAGR